jgi:hypothetical protein
MKKSYAQMVIGFSIAPHGFICVNLRPTAVSRFIRVQAFFFAGRFFCFFPTGPTEKAAAWPPSAFGNRKRGVTS